MWASAVVWQPRHTGLPAGRASLAKEPVYAAADPDCCWPGPLGSPRGLAASPGTGFIPAGIWPNVPRPLVLCSPSLLLPAPPVLLRPPLKAQPSRAQPGSAPKPPQPKAKPKQHQPRDPQEPAHGVHPGGPGGSPASHVTPRQAGLWEDMLNTLGVTCSPAAHARRGTGRLRQSRPRSSATANPTEPARGHAAVELQRPELSAPAPRGCCAGLEQPGKQEAREDQHHGFICHDPTVQLIDELQVTHKKNGPKIYRNFLFLVQHK